jgi:Ca2+-binding EF-hand superfamily protein
VQAVVPPPYVAEMSVAHKEEGLFYRFLAVFSEVRQPSKHEQLFGALGANGPRLFMHFIKCILLFSVVSIAALCVILFQPLWELSFVLPFLAAIPAIIAIFLTPRMVILYVWCCSTEMLKDPDVVIQVVRKMRHEKLLNIIRILSMLSFFLDQVEFLKSVAGGEGDGDDDDEKQAVTEAQWAKLIETTDPKIVEDLEALFVAYDDDDSGELDVDEVRELVGQLGTKLSDAEAKNLFRVMDADGSGSVDFKEFAMVILHQKQQSSGQIDYRKLAEKMFAIFDQDGSGAVQQDEILDQMKKMGKNWDHEGIAFFLSQIDKDGSGEIDKNEFVDYIMKIEAEVKSG